MKRRVLILEPSAVVAKGLVSLLNEGMAVWNIDMVAHVSEFRNKVRVSPPDLVLANPMCIDSPDSLGLPEGCPILAIVYQYYDPKLLAAFDGVIGICDDREAITAKMLAATETAAPTRASVAYELSKRETMVLVEVAKGLTNKEIADTLNVSVHTIISHRKNIMRKTGIKSVAGLTVYAIIHNLIDESALL